ncbi:MAG TPA: hypothetical protein VFQ22_12015 [Longimicrobiales bacterium]|nr:hypothetical protein [Longimicrobiales bacterium]
MRRDDDERTLRAEPRLPEPERAEKRTPGHVVFDFTGLARPDVCDLSLILTARLHAPPTENVWVRSLPEETERVLKALRLDHLFRPYPSGPDELN